MKLLIALLLAISSVTSWGCHSWGCRTIKKRCWRPSCGLNSYLTNQDYFLYWWKPAVKVLKLVPSDWEKELAAAQAKNAAEMEALNTEIEEVRQNSIALATENKREIESVRSELADAQAEIRAVRAEAAQAVADARSELNEFKAQQKKKDLRWADLNAELRTDVENLRTTLYDHKRDDLRSVVLWPRGCGYDCTYNYKTVYAVWTRLSARLVRTYNVRWAGFPCSRRLRVMRTHFNRWCAPYPEPVRVRLLGYYDYLVAGKACSW